MILIQFLIFVAVSSFFFGPLAQASSDTIKLGYTFEEVAPDNVGFFLTDYPAGNEGFYQIDVGVRPMPIEIGKRNGLRFKCFNHSDDTDTNLVFHLGTTQEIAPSKKYRIKIEAKIASNSPSGLLGVGGAPSDVTFRFAAAPKTHSFKYAASSKNLKLVLDKGSVVSPSIGDLGNGEEEEGRRYRIISRSGEVIASASKTGEIFLYLQTHSGFEGLSDFYYDEILLTLTPL